MLIRAVFFDFDGVLTTDSSGSLSMSRQVCREFPALTVERVLAAFRTYGEDRGIDAGTINETQVWEGVCSTLGIHIKQGMRDAILRNVPVNKPMFAVARSLSNRYTVGMITDNSDERIRLIDDDLHLRDLFDPIIVSARLRATKRDNNPMIYEAALRAAKCNPDESIFIDNNEANLIVPATMGIKTYWHDDATNNVSALIGAFEQWGVEVTGVSGVSGDARLG